LGLIFNFLWAMVLVVGLAYLAARLLKKMGWGKVSHAQYLEQIDFLPLGPKRGIALVQIANKTVALGVSEHGISLLMEVDSEAVKERAAARMASPEAILPQFADELWRKIRRTEGKL
jgi:flagellar protein FliO/FliZ